MKNTENIKNRSRKINCRAVGFIAGGSFSLFLFPFVLRQALKTNSSLKFAVLTGCLRISKESIFTGLNNLKVLSIADERFDEYFGFTDREVRELLAHYDIENHYDEIKTWYDKINFGLSIKSYLVVRRIPTPFLL